MASRRFWSLLIVAAAALSAMRLAAAINVGINGYADVLAKFSAMNSSDLLRIFNSSVTFGAVRVPLGRSGADITNLTNSLTAGAFDMILGTFDELLASACSYLSLPFYSLSDKLLDPLFTSAAYLTGSTTVLANTLLDELMLASVNFTTTIAQRSTIVMLVDEVSSRLNIIFDKNITGIQFRISTVNTSLSSDVRQLLYDSITYASVETSVYMIVSSAPGFTASILKEAVYLSMLGSSSYWLMPDVFLDKREITPYYSSGATIVTFRLPNSNITNQSQLNMSMATDSIQHYLASASMFNVSNTTTIMQKIFQTTVNGLVSKLHFSSDDRRQDSFAANLMAVDPTSSTELVMYATWNESVPNSIAISRTKVSLGLPVLRLAGALIDPFIKITPNGYSGFCINVLEKISANLFTYDINDLTKSTSADYLQAVQLNKADIAVNLVELTAALLNDSRIIVSDIPLLTSGVASLGRSAVKDIDFLTPLYPLTWNVWFAIILAFIILSATLYLTDKISPNDYKRPKYSVASAAFFVYSSFVMSKLKSSAVKPSSRIFILILWFASLMYCTTYGTNYFFLLISTNPNLPFTSLSGLYNVTSNYNYYWLMVQNSLEYKLLQAQNTTVYQNILSNPSLQFVPNVSAAVGIIKNATLPNQKRPIFIGDELTCNYYAAQECVLKSAGRNELSRYLHMVFNRNLSASLVTNINNRLQELSDKGELEQIKNNYWSVILCSASENLITYSELTDVTLDQVAGIFIVLAAAFVLSFLVVALEHIGHIIGLQIQRTTADPKLQFNSTYSAVVTGIVPDGVYVKLHGEREFIPNQMLSPDASKDLTASDLQIAYGQSIDIIYLGNDPVDGYRIFRRRA